MNIMIFMYNSNIYVYVCFPQFFFFFFLSFTFYSFIAVVAVALILRGAGVMEECLML